ncbi:hypothetical protein ACFXG6_24550 [Streptomyces roseus]|uniref:hypothetical protein n=1 Tax=Streptomyces roseus TaxID=66430 RepID=UPI0036C4940E
MAPDPQLIMSMDCDRDSVNGASAGVTSRARYLLVVTSGLQIRRIELREATAAGSDAEYREEDLR